MRLVLLWMLGLALLVPVLAEQERVYVISLHYTESGFTVKQIAIKEGYAPGRKLQEGSYHAELVDKSNAVLYGFNFEVPLLLFTDSSQGGEMHGSVIKLNETDFVLVVPFYDGARLQIAKVGKPEEQLVVAQLSPQATGKRLVKMGIWMIAGAILLIGYYLVRKKIGGQEPPDNSIRENPYMRQLYPPGQYRP